MSRTASGIAIEDTGVTLPWWIPTPDAIAERERLMASQYFLVAISGNAGVGEVWRCRGCGSKHRYLTLRCVEQPFNGVTGGLYAFWRVVGAAGAEQWLSEAQRQRFDELSAMFGQADLSSMHPNMARAMSIGNRDADIGSLALGVLEPITRQKARDLTRAINMRGISPPFRCAGVDDL